MTSYPGGRVSPQEYDDSLHEVVGPRDARPRQCHRLQPRTAEPSWLVLSRRRRCSSDRGFVVYAYDRIGSGASSGGMALRRGKIVRVAWSYPATGDCSWTRSTRWSSWRVSENPGEWHRALGQQLRHEDPHGLSVTIAHTGWPMRASSPRSSPHPATTCNSGTMPLPFSQLSVLLGGHAEASFPFRWSSTGRRQRGLVVRLTRSLGSTASRVTSSLFARGHERVLSSDAQDSERYGNRRPHGAEDRGCPAFV